MPGIIAKPSSTNPAVLPHLRGNEPPSVPSDNNPPRQPLFNPTGTGCAYIYNLDNPVEFSQILNVSASYINLAGIFMGGSPRFVFGFDNGLDVDIPWQALAGIGTGNTNNVIGTSDMGWDDSQLSGGSPWTTYANVLSLAGSLNVVDVWISEDAGWAGTQGVEVGNFAINGVEGRAIPEPTTILVWGLLGVVAAGYGVWRRRRAD